MYDQFHDQKEELRLRVLCFFKEKWLDSSSANTQRASANE
jgi:hypothetical protein